jgi:hypothetical protein
VPRVESGLKRGGISREGLGPSSEAGTHLRGNRALERGGNSPEGTEPSSDAVVSWCSACPSSEAEVHPRGAEADCSLGC